MESYDAIIIGAGNAGIGAAAALASEGLKPLVIERHNLPGGCATSIVRGRFEFDATIHALLYDCKPLADPTFKECWERLGIEEPMVPIKGGFINVFLDEDGNRKEYVFPDGVDQFIESMEKQRPGSEAELKKFFEIGQEVLDGSLLFQDIMLGSDGDTPEMTKKRKEFHEKYPHYEEYVSLSTQDAFDKLGLSKDIQEILGILWFYAGTKLEDLPFMLYYTIFACVLDYDCYFPVHTAHGYLAEFEKYIRDRGGDIWYNTEVTEITVKNKKVCGIKTDQGDQIATDCVICNAPLSVAYHKLIQPKSEVKDFNLKLTNSMKDNFSFVVVYLGLNATAQEIGIQYHHQYVNTTNDYHQTFAAGYTLDRPFCMGGLCPNITVPDISPEGTCILSISVPLQAEAFEGLSQKEYFQAKEKIAEDIVDEYEKVTGLDLRSHIEEICIATPETLARYAGLPSGGLGSQLNLENHPIVNTLSKYLEHYIKGLTFTGQFEKNIGYANNPYGIAAGFDVAKKLKGGK